MRSARLLVILFVVPLLVLSSGCANKKWSYVFTSVWASMDDWYCTTTGSHNLDTAGLCLNGRIISTPVYFTGDTSLKITADIEITKGSIVSFRFGISDGLFWTGANDILTEIHYIGDDAMESWLITDDGGTGEEFYPHADPVAGIDYDGINTFEFSRTGTKATFSVNGSLIEEIDIIYFDINTDGFIPSIAVIGDLGALTIKRIDVTYSGDESEEWPF